MPIVSLSNADIAYEREGAGHPLLLIMGIGGQLIQWPPEFREALIKRGFELILVDNRDAGLSSLYKDTQKRNPSAAIIKQALKQPIDAPYTLEDMAKDKLELLDHLGIEQCHVLGISMGSMIAQIFAAKYGNRVQSLNLMHSNTGKRRHAIMKPRALNALLNRGGNNSKESYIDGFVRLFQVIGSPNLSRPETDLRKFAEIAYERGHHPEGFVRQFLAILATGDRERFFSNIQCPTTVIHGHKDPLMPMSAGRALVKAIPNAKGFFFPDLGHDIPVKYCDTFAQIIHHNSQAE